MPKEQLGWQRSGGRFLGQPDPLTPTQVLGEGNGRSLEERDPEGLEQCHPAGLGVMKGMF